MVGAVSESEVAFTVHNPGDPNPATVRGTVFYDGVFNADRRAILLLHGATLDRRFWDGFGIPGAPSVARRLVSLTGNAVFTIDRLGYGESQYSGPGLALTPDTYVETTHEIVAEIIGGTYQVLDGSVTPTGASGVVLGGQSIGSAELELYATRYDDVDGLIPFGWSNFGPTPSQLEKIMGEVVAPQILAVDDYFYFFPPEDDNYSELCEEAVYYVPGVNPDVLAEACSNGYHNTAPAGEILGVDAMTAEVRENAGNVTAPILLMFGRQDNMVTGPGWGGLSGTDADVVTPEIDLWTSSCKCDVSVYWVEDASHDFPLHETADAAARAMARWLHQLPGSHPPTRRGHRD